LSDNDDLATISVEAFFEGLCGALSEAVLEPAGVRCEASIESGELPAWQCHRLALMLTELVTNAAKHAFPDKNGALIRIEVANR
ncbi:histidine kinase, partial [Pseudomonas sp. GW247-3R2A]